MCAVCGAHVHGTRLSANSDKCVAKLLVSWFHLLVAQIKDCLLVQASIERSAEHIGEYSSIFTEFADSGRNKIIGCEASANMSLDKRMGKPF